MGEGAIGQDTCAVIARPILALHKESKESPVYRLTVATGGPKLEESDGTGSFHFSTGPEGFIFRSTEMMRLSGFLPLVSIER